MPIKSDLEKQIASLKADLEAEQILTQRWSEASDNMADEISHLRDENGRCRAKNAELGSLVNTLHAGNRKYIDEELNELHIHVIKLETCIEVYEGILANIFQKHALL